MKQSPNKKCGCEECVLEKWRHNQTKRALNKAIGLAHRLMQEVHKLERHILDIEHKPEDSMSPNLILKDPKKPICLE